MVVLGENVIYEERLRTNLCWVKGERLLGRRVGKKGGKNKRLKFGVDIYIGMCVVEHMTNAFEIRENLSYSLFFKSFEHNHK